MTTYDIKVKGLTVMERVTRTTHTEYERCSNEGMWLRGGKMEDVGCNKYSLKKKPRPQRSCI